MSRIDSQMMGIYKESTRSSSMGGKTIAEQEAILLIKRAQEINESSGHSCFSSSSTKGNKYLMRLVKHNKEAFSDESRAMIKSYLKTGRMPEMVRPSMHHAGGGIHTRPSRPSISPGENMGGTMVDSHPSTPRPTSRPNANGGSVVVNAGSGMPASSDRPSVNNGGRIVVSDNPGAPRPGSMPPPANNPSSGIAAPGGRPSVNDSGTGAPVNVGRPSVGTPSSPERPNGGTVDGIDGGSDPVVSPGVKEIMNFIAKKLTWGCHWFPMQETRPGGDPVNNLYAQGGPLDKLDMITGMKAREYEFAHNRKAVDAGKEYSWWGHCDKAATAACILAMPKHGVTMVAQNGEKVHFTKNDIQGLLVKAVPDLSIKVDFKGERFNNPARDNPNDPAPEFFLEVMQEWAKDGMPFVLDIDPGVQVWNFPYDKAKVTESTTAPEGYDASALPQDGSVKYYHIDMSGTGFDEKARRYECFIQRDAGGKVVKSGWIKTPNTHNNPDFMWRPHPAGDIMNPNTWVSRGAGNNPQVDLKTIFEIYQKSLA